MENLEIKVSDDKLKAFIKIEAEDPEDAESLDIEKEDIKKALAEKGISFGIDWNKIDKIIANNNYSQEILIAAGKAPLPGKDGKLIYHFEEKEKQAGTLRADGTMDFHSLDLINNVRAGERLVTKLDPEPGSKGKSVFGTQLLPPPVREAKLPHSKNTVQKNKSLYAAVDGQIVREFQKIVIKDVYTVNGDVDLNTGNIDFVGSVKVNGDVQEGFKIKAEGDIEITGRAGACELISGGSILIKKGFIGRNKGRAEAEGNFCAKFIENAAVEAENVKVGKAVMHSKIKARDSIEVTGAKGLIVGGKITARNLIKANLIGSSLATKTLIEIGKMPELKEKLKKNKSKRKKVLANLNKIKKSLELLENIQARGIKLPADKKELLEKLELARTQLTKEKTEIEEIIKNLDTKINFSTKALVEVNNCIFSGVQILTAHDKKIIQNKLKGCKFKEDKKEIRKISD